MLKYLQTDHWIVDAQQNHKLFLQKCWYTHDLTHTSLTKDINGQMLLITYYVTSSGLSHNKNDTDLLI